MLYSTTPKEVNVAALRKKNAADTAARTNHSRRAMRVFIGIAGVDWN